MKQCGISKIVCSTGWAIKGRVCSFRPGNATASIKVTAALMSQAPRRETDNIIISINYAQILGLRGREFYLDPQIATAHDNLKDIPLEEGYSRMAVLGKEKLLAAAQENLCSARGRVALIQPELIIDPMLIPGTMALLEQTGHYETVIQLATQAQSLTEHDLKSSGATQANLIDWHRDITLASALSHCGMAKASIEEGHAAMGCARLEEALAILQKGLPAATASLKSNLKTKPLALRLQMRITAALSDFKAEAILDFLRKPLDLAHVMQRQHVLAALADMLQNPHELPEQQPAAFVAHALKHLTAEETCFLIPDWERVITASSMPTPTANVPQQGTAPGNSHTTLASNPAAWCSPAVAARVALSYLVAGFVQRRPQLVSTAERMFHSIRNVADVAVPHAVCDVLLGRPSAALDALKEDERVGAALITNAGVPRSMVASKRVSLPHQHTTQRQRQATSGPLKFPEREEVMAFIRGHSPSDKDLLPGLCLFVEGYLQCKAFPLIRDTAERPTDPSLSAYFDDPKTAASLEGSSSETSSSMAHFAGNIVARVVRHMVSLTAFLVTLPPMHPSTGAGTISAPEGGRSSGMATTNAIGTAPSTNGRSRKNEGKHANALTTVGSAALLACALLGAGRWTAMNAAAQRRQPAVAPGSVAAAVRSGYWQSSVYSRQAKEHHTQLLMKETAQSLIQDWLNIKAEAMGPRHKTSRLSSVLAEPMLTAVTTEAKEAAASGWFWNIRPLKVRILSIDSSALTPESGYAVVTASVDESADLWATNGKKGDSYKSEYRVEYCVVRSGGGWKVASALVLGR